MQKFKIRFNFMAVNCLLIPSTASLFCRSGVRIHNQCLDNNIDTGEEGFSSWFQYNFVDDCSQTDIQENVKKIHFDNFESYSVRK